MARTAFVMDGGKDQNGHPITARVTDYICVSKNTVGADGVILDFQMALADPANFTHKELLVMLQLQRVLGLRSGTMQHVKRRVSVKKLAEALRWDRGTVRNHLERLAARDIIIFHMVGRGADNTTHEVGWNLHFGDWKGIRWQGPDMEEGTA